MTKIVYIDFLLCNDLSYLIYSVHFNNREQKQVGILLTAMKATQFLCRDDTCPPGIFLGKKKPLEEMKKKHDRGRGKMYKREASWHATCTK